jgi:hypothetical protein
MKIYIPSKNNESWGKIQERRWDFAGQEMKDKR